MSATWIFFVSTASCAVTEGNNSHAGFGHQFSFYNGYCSVSKVGFPDRGSLG